MTLLVAAAAPVRAQGILELNIPGEEARVVPAPEPGLAIIPEPRPIPGPIPRPVPPRPFPERLLPAQLTSLELELEIEGQVARTTLDQTFRNPNNRRLEGTYLFPLPPNAAVRDLSLYIDGKPVKAEVLDAAKARAIYEDIVRRQRDPALLEYVGRDLVKLRIFPVEPLQERRVRFQYSQVLTRDFGLTEYTYPLVARSQLGQPVGSFSLHGSLRADLPIASIYSPTHEIEFIRKDDKTVTFGYEKSEYDPVAALRIYYGVSDKDLGAGLVAFKKGEDDGYFMLMIAPRKVADKQKIIDKDVTFVFDTSGSMNGDKIAQARQALRFCLNSLRPGDRFNVIRFSTETEPFAEGLVPTSEPQVKKALEFVDGFEATGGTAINQALMEGVKGRTGVPPVIGEKGRPHLIVFLTDGLPTVGPRDAGEILANVEKANEGRARIFTFGVGNDVNAQLLDRVAEQSGGVSDYVAPQEDIEVKVSNFFAKVAEPVLTDVTVEYGGVKVAQSYPDRLPDLFAGSQVKVIGRYKTAGATTVVLRGRVGDEERVFEYPLEFPAESTAADFLPRLWAIRRVGYLVDEIRKNGENAELRDEIVRLGKKYAIATPYTSLLVLEDGEWSRVDRPMAAAPPALMAPSGPRPAFRGGGAADGSRMFGRTEALAMPAPADMPQAAQGSAGLPMLRAESGAAGVAIARQTREMKEADMAGRSKEAEVQTVGDRTFYLKDGVWTDSEYDGQAATIDITYGSDEYFALLAKGGDVGKFLALGARVLFRLDGKWYRIVE